MFATCGGSTLERVNIHVPYQGPWFAELSWLDEAASVLPGANTLVIGSVSFVGTIDPLHTGTYGAKKTGRLVAGANGWNGSIVHRAYANDAGIKAADVASDAAKLVGESMGSFVGGVDRLGSHYQRDAGTASRTIEDVARGVPWWVDYLGITHVGPRPVVPAPGAYTILSYDPRHNLAILSVDSVDAVTIGSALVDQHLIPKGVTVRSMEIVIAPGSLRIRAWCGVSGENWMAQALRNVVARCTDQRLLGKFRYRVVAQNGTTVDLQWVKRSQAVTMPDDMLRVDMTSGVGGSHPTLTPGCIVYVEFVDGMRDDPIITAFEGRGNDDAVPQMLELGGPNGTAVALNADVVTILLPPFAFSGVTSTGPITGVMTALTGQTLGTITGPSATKVKAK
jgi:hypothetical protein